MKVLTPAALTPHGGSLRLLYLVFRTSNPQPRDGPERRFRSRLNVLDGSCDPGFAMNEQARRTMPPKRVRHPAGCSFASSCSPPRIAATQLPSATCATTSHRTDFHPPDKATSQTHSFPRTRESRAPARAAESGCPLSRRFRGHDSDFPSHPLTLYDSPIYLLAGGGMNLGDISAGKLHDSRDPAI
jgi:hypothetical protein